MIQSNRSIPMCSAPVADLPLDRPIRVLLIISSLEHGGAERQLIHLANHLPKDRFEVSICSLSDVISLADSLTDRSCLHVIEKRWKFDIDLIRRVADLMRKLRIDLVHAFLMDAEMVARFAARLAGVPVVIASERNTDYHRPVHHEVAQRLTKPFYDAMIANSHSGKRFNVRTLGVRADRIEVVYNGVDVDYFSPSDGTGVRRSVGLGPENLVVGMAAMFKRQKNHALFFEVARQLAPRHPNLYFWCAGEPLRENIQGTENYHASMLQMVKDLGITDRVMFLGARDDMPAFYSACDVTMLTSTREGVPNVLLESMACGVPVVATDVADNALIVPEGTAGHIVKLGDAAALAERLEGLLADPARRREMGHCARDWVVREFSIAALVRKTGAIYEQWVQRKGPRRRGQVCTG